MQAAPGDDHVDCQCQAGRKCQLGWSTSPATHYAAKQSQHWRQSGDTGNSSNNYNYHLRKHLNVVKCTRHRPLAPAKQTAGNQPSRAVEENTAGGEGEG